MKNSTVDVAIIGAGTAGALTANQLTAAGLQCAIIEKSRGLGGRCSRRVILDGFSIDLGAPSFSLPYSDHPNVMNNINKWLKSGALREWRFNSSDFETPLPAMKKVELCGSPSMNAFHRHLVEGINCLTQRHVQRLKRSNETWQLIDSSDQLIIEAKSVIVTAPAEQTYHLVSPYHLATLNNKAPQDSQNPILKASESSRPQYVCAITFEKPQTQLYDVYSGKHSVFSKAIRANSKPLPTDSMVEKMPEVWVLHSTYDWAKQQQHQDAQSVAEEMGRLFCQHFNILEPEITGSMNVVASHYWRLADHEHEIIKQCFNLDKGDNQPFLWDENLKLGCCADWLAGGGIAGALSSSQELSNHVTSQLRKGVKR